MNIKFNRNLKLKYSPDPDWPQFTKKIGILGTGAEAKIEISPITVTAPLPTIADPIKNA